MFIKTLNSVFRAPEDDTGKNNNGGSRIGASLTAQLGEEEPLDDGGEFESDSSGVDSSGADLYRAYHKLDRDGKSKSSILGKHLDKADEEGKEEESGSEVKIQIGSKKAAAKDESEEEELKPEQEEDELKQLLDIDPSKVRTKAGGAISIESGKVIAKFKENLTKLKNENDQLKKQTADPQLTEKYKALEDEHRVLKDQFENEHFEKSPAFEAAYIAPVTNQTLKVQKYFSHLTDENDAEEIVSLNRFFNQAIKAAEAGEEVQFNRIMDKIADEHVDGGGAIKGKFAIDMEKLFELTYARKKAFEAKGEDRRKNTELILQEQRSKNVNSIDSDLDRHVRAFEISKAPVLEGLDGEDRKEYVKMYAENVPLVKKAVSDFLVTGKINDNLKEIIKSGVTAKAMEHENKLAWVAYSDMNNKLKIINEENQSLKKKIAKLSGEPEDIKRGRYVQEDKSKKKESQTTKGRSAIWQAFQSLSDD
jgi:hypothetical protein